MHDLLFLRDTTDENIKRNIMWQSLINLESFLKSTTFLYFLRVAFKWVVLLSATVNLKFVTLHKCVTTCQFQSHWNLNFSSNWIVSRAKTTQLHKPIFTQDQQLSSLVVHTLQWSNSVTSHIVKIQFVSR